MNQGDTTVFRSTQDAEETFIPETWIKFFNGPNAGLIDTEAARREIPWLLSSKALSLQIGEGRHCVTNYDVDG